MKNPNLLRKCVRVDDATKFGLTYTSVSRAIKSEITRQRKRTRKRRVTKRASTRWWLWPSCCRRWSAGTFSPHCLLDGKIRPRSAFDRFRNVAKNVPNIRAVDNRTRTWTTHDPARRKPDPWSPIFSPISGWNVRPCFHLSPSSCRSSCSSSWSFSLSWSIRAGEARAETSKSS